MGLRDKYSSAVSTAKNLHMQGSAEEREGKLYFNGTVNSDDEKNQIWNAIKTIPDWQTEIVADIKVAAAAHTPAAHHDDASRSYTVQSGDTLSAIAKKFYGNATDYMEIFNANRDQLTNPDQILPGQVLKIPQHAHK